MKMVWMVLLMPKDKKTAEERIQEQLDKIKRLAGMGDENLHKM